MNDGGMGIVMMLLWLAVVAVWLWGLIDAARRPAGAFEAAGSNKVLWIVLTVILGALGSLIYLLAVRPKVVRAAAPAR